MDKGERIPVREGRSAWILKHFCLIALVGVLCLGVGLFFGRMLLRQKMGTLTIETGRTLITEQTPLPATGDRLNLNSASRKELAALPGIGPTLAERIVEYRRINGPFHFPYEIMDVDGIDEKIYVSLRDRITAD